MNGVPQIDQHDRGKSRHQHPRRRAGSERPMIKSGAQQVYYPYNANTVVPIPIQPLTLLNTTQLWGSKIRGTKHRISRRIIVLLFIG